MSADPKFGRAAALALVGVLAAYFALVARFEWICDDAFISLRYARNLVQGRGLVFNPGEDPPVEGFTNLLWVLWLAPFELAGLDTPLVARWSAAACGAALLVLLFRALASSSGRWIAAGCAALFVAALPPFAVWSTSGLETMPFALALFGAFCALTAEHARPRLAIVSASAAVLLRADGFAFVGLVLAAAASTNFSARSRERSRALVATALAVSAVVAAHFLWRRWYFGAWTPNTARVKVELGAQALEFGAKYAATFLAAFPSVLVAAVYASVEALRRRDTRSMAALIVAAGVFAYAMLVGGDFMAMGRFLVPALPFLALAFGRALGLESGAGRTKLAVSLALTAACVALSLPAGWNAHVTPARVREAFRFRFNNPQWLSEYEQWVMMKDQARLWTFLGRALKARTQPGESLVVGTIGATGYYSDLWIFDPYGLVNREEFAPLTEQARRAPGHQRRIPLETFLAQRPTYLEASLVLRDKPYSDVRPGAIPGGLKNNPLAAPQWLEVQDVEDMPGPLVLRLVRYVPQ